MKSILTYQQAMNQSSRVETQTSKNYQHQIKHIILESAKNYQNPVIGVLGYGNGMDLPLETLLDQFSKVVLMDIDLEAMIGALTRDDVSMDKIELVECDVTSLDSIHFIEHFNEALNQNQPLRAFKELMARAYDSKFLWSSHLDQKFDILVMLPMYTQLVYFQIEQLIDQHQSFKMKSSLKEHLLNWMPEVFSHVNEGMLSLMHIKSTLIVWTDVMKLVPSNLEEEVSEKTLQTMYQDYQSTYGVGLGDFPLTQLESFLETTQTVYLKWTRHVNETLLVIGRVYKKKR